MPDHYYTAEPASAHDERRVAVRALDNDLTFITDAGVFSRDGLDRGTEALLDRLEANEKAGIVYHREGIMGDYDEIDDLEELIDFIKTGERNNER